MHHQYYYKNSRHSIFKPRFKLFLAILLILLLLLLLILTYIVSIRFFNIQRNNKNNIYPTKTKFDFFVLSVSWPPGFCQTSSCNLTPPNFWTIHGLWPSNFCKAYPKVCTDEKFNPNLLTPIKSDMIKYWPTLSPYTNNDFWAHEWITHGTCATDSDEAPSIKDQFSYFNVSLNLGSVMYNLTHIFLQSNILPGGTYNLIQLQEAFPNKLAVTYQCDKKGNLISAKMCLSTSFKLVTCKCMQSNCPNNSIHYLKYPSKERSTQ